MGAGTTHRSKTKAKGRGLETMMTESKSLIIIITIAYAFFILSAIIGELINESPLIAMGFLGSFSITILLISSLLIPDSKEESK